MSDDTTQEIYKRYGRLREIYPDDIDRIEREEEQLSKLLALKAYSELPETQNILALCRNHIVFIKKKLATDRKLIDDEDAQRDLWAEIDARQWFLQYLARDYAMQLALIESDLDQQLAEAVG